MLISSVLYAKEDYFVFLSTWTRATLMHDISLPCFDEKHGLFLLVKMLFVGQNNIRCNLSNAEVNDTFCDRIFIF